MKHNLLFICLFTLALFGCADSTGVLPVQYKDLRMTLDKNQIENVIYSPVGNGVLSVMTKSGQYDMTLIQYDTAHALAAKLSLQPDSHFTLFDTLFNADLAEDKKSIVNQIFATVNVETLAEVGSATHKIFIAERLNDSFEIYAVALADDNGYYAIRGFSSLEAAKEFAGKISFHLQ